MFKIRKIFFVFVIIFLCLQASIVFAGLKLEQTYPDIGVKVQTITKDATIPNLIKYYSTWAIIIAILVCIISLIIGGVAYLTSGGKPAATVAARARIVKGLTGLAILITSYLILGVINPQMSILRIKKISISSGIVLLNKQGLDELKGTLPTAGNPGIPAKPLKEIVEKGDAIPMKYWVLNAVETDLGDFETVDPNDRDGNGVATKVNFKNFEVCAVGFWGKDAKNVKLITYAGKDFKGDKKEYTSEGELDEKGHLVTGKLSVQYGVDPVVDVIALDQDGFFKSQVAFTDNDRPPTGNPPQQPAPITYKANTAPLVFHPPLSWRRQGIGPGLYLYSDTSQRYLSPGNRIADFSSNLFGSNEPIQKIEIRNLDQRTGEKYDILAVLRSRPNYNGGIRLFFEKKSLLNAAGVFFISKYNESVVKIDDNDFKTGSGQEFEFFPNGIMINNVTLYRGNTPTYNYKATKQDDINKNMIEALGIDQYGKLGEVLSAETFELSDDKSVCKEVKICNQPDFNGYCISFSLGGKDLGEYQTFTLPMPWYWPVNIPKWIRGKVRMQDGTEKELKEKIFELGGNVNNPDAKFAENIRSIKINGRCLVVLFQSDVWQIDCAKCSETGNANDCKKCWFALEEPGNHSEVFVGNGDINGGDPDLSDNLIGQCSGGAEGISLKDVSPCASSIVVFPIE